ncbi:MAG: sterol desaturase family protein [Pseudomonadota bacterium]
MTDFALANEVALRLSIFVGLVAALALFQWWRPRRATGQGARRTLTNIALGVVDTLALRVAFPVLAVELAWRWQASGHGLNGLPLWLALPLTLLLMDFAIYWQHRLMHTVPALWRLHRTHHTDTHLDVTTAVRFHPLEILLSMGFKLALVLALGAPALGVLMFELILSACALFNHANIDLGSFDRPLRRVIVTPDMHRIHHSIRDRESHHNFGFALSVWDHWFGSHQSDPDGGHKAMRLGNTEFQSPRQLSVSGLLLNPFSAERDRATPDE